VSGHTTIKNTKRVRREGGKATIAVTADSGEDDAKMVLHRKEHNQPARE
jgi:hypothetical protein